MPFPIDEKYIKETESELNVKFPTEFKNRMIKSNGGELVTDDFEFELYPFFDKSDRKKLVGLAITLDLKRKMRENGMEFLKIESQSVRTNLETK